jgi:uncharacterized protein (UPF0333 family)
MTAIIISLAIFSLVMLLIVLISFKIIINLIKEKIKLNNKIFVDALENRKRIAALKNQYEYDIIKVTTSFDKKLKLLQNTSSDKVLSASQKDIISFLIPCEELQNPCNSDPYQRYIVEEKVKYLKKNRIAGECSFSNIYVDSGQIKSQVYKELLDFLMKENFIYIKIEDANRPFDDDKIVTFHFNYYK